MIDVRLYVDGQRVDLDNNSLIVLSYTLDDTTNPTIVKNSFSKSVTLPSTKNNDLIFGNMRSLNARVAPSVGFSPLVRTPFQLFSNGELIESGYVQLKEIVTKGGISSYKVTLFGGLGDFFYSLMYDADGNKRTLADLDYGIVGATDSESEMDFAITKEIVNASWAVVGDGRNTLDEAITFIPAYNGLGKDFDNEHALINTYRLPSALPTRYSNNGKTYSLLNGYGLATLPKPLNEWEVQDLRSYRQRPALSVRMLMQALATPANNGGYKVVLDDTFFNEENPLYHDAYITLPMLGNERSEVDRSIDVTLPNITLTAGVTLGDVVSANYELPSILPQNTPIQVSIPITLEILPRSADVSQLYDSIYQPNPTGGRPYYVNSWIVVQAVAKNTQNNVVGVSNIYSFSTSDHNFLSYLDEGLIEGYTPLNSSQSTAYSHVQGTYELGNGRYIFNDEAKNNTFPIPINFFKNATSEVRVEVRAQRVFSSTWGSVFNNDSDEAAFYFPRRSYERFATASRDGYSYLGRTQGEFTDSKIVAATENLPAVASGSKVTKRLLLSTEATPADYLLSYAKLFGLRFIKDKYEKKVTITRSNYFTGRIHDITQRIDRDSDIKITPSVFDKRIMRLALNTPDTYFTRKYKEAQGVDYAQKRIDTGYGFNSETEDVYKDSIFNTAVPCRIVSPAFYTYSDTKGRQVPSIWAYNFDFALADISGGTSVDKLDTYSEYQRTSNSIDNTRSIPFSDVKGYDATPKMCYFDMKDDLQESVDIANNLVIFCGRVTPRNASGHAITYYLTDDQPEMLQLNGRPCYLVTATAINAAGSNIAIIRSSLPQFLSVRLINNKVYDSFDFAVSKENYLGEDIDYSESNTLYNRYWQGYYEDRMDVNTRIVECMVNLDGMRVDGDTLRDFYYFDGAYWLLNKIIDYDPQTMKLTKCQFVKVKNISTYQGQ